MPEFNSSDLAQIVFDLRLDPSVLDQLLEKQDILMLVPAWREQSSKLRTKSIALAWCLLINRRKQGASRNIKADLCSLIGIGNLMTLAQCCHLLSSATRRFVLCPGCKRLPKQWRIEKCGHCTCACTAPSCPTCALPFKYEDCRSIRACTDPRTDTVLQVQPDVEFTSLGSDSEISSCPARVLSGSNYSTLMEVFRNMITILENIPEVEEALTSQANVVRVVGDKAKHAVSPALTSNSSAPTIEEFESTPQVESLEFVQDIPKASASFDGLQDGTNALSQLNKLSQTGSVSLEWSCMATDSGWKAELTIPLVDVKGSAEDVNKKSAQHAAARKVLPELREKLASMQNDQAESSHIVSLAALHENYQKLFKTSPKFEKIENLSERPPLFQASLDHEGRVVVGSSKPSKQAAKCDVLREVLGSRDSSNTENEQASSAEGCKSGAHERKEFKAEASSPSKSLSALQENYQRRFKATPKYEVVTSSKEQQPAFRAKVFHDGSSVVGIWCRNKNSAKCSALEALFDSLDATISGTTAQQLVMCDPLAGASEQHVPTLPTLHEDYQRRFKTSPSWGKMEEKLNDDGAPLFQACIMQGENIIEGDWEHSKQAAKFSAMKRVLG